VKVDSIAQQGQGDDEGYDIKRLDRQDPGGVDDSSKRQEKMQRTGRRSSAMNIGNDEDDIMCIHRVL